MGGVPIISLKGKPKKKKKQGINQSLGGIDFFSFMLALEEFPLSIAG